MNKAQRVLVFKVIRQVWERVCWDEGKPAAVMGDRAAMEAWRKGEMKKLGLTSLAALGNRAVDRVLLHFGTLAQNEAVVKHAAESDDRRHRAAVRKMMGLLRLARGEVVSWSSVRTIMDRMELAEDLDDVSAFALQKVLVDTQFRRLCRKLELRPVEFRAMAETEAGQAVIRRMTGEKIGNAEMLDAWLGLYGRRVRENCGLVLMTGSKGA